RGRRRAAPGSCEPSRSPSRRAHRLPRAGPEPAFEARETGRARRSRGRVRPFAGWTSVWPVVPRPTVKPNGALLATGMNSPVAALEIPLRGPGGEPVDLVRTFMSHGVADLPPGRVDEEASAYITTLALRSTKPRTVRIVSGRSGFAQVEVQGRELGARGAREVEAAVRAILNLDEDLSGFYALVDEDPDLAWAARGAGRMRRTPTVFEAVVKTVCTTNCAWSATIRMVTAVVEHLGEPAAAGDGRAFPTPEVMAAADEEFYRATVRAGYRGAYLRSL